MSYVCTLSALSGSVFAKREKKTKRLTSKQKKTVQHTLGQLMRGTHWEKEEEEGGDDDDCDDDDCDDHKVSSTLFCRRK